MKSNLEIARSIKDDDMRINAGGLVAIRKYPGWVDGKHFTRSSRWWAAYKMKTEGAKFLDDDFISKRIGRGWDEYWATGAHHNERLRDYKKRMKDDSDDKKRLRRELLDKFIYTRWAA